VKLASLPADVLEKVKAYRWDGFIEKHEGPFGYGKFRRFTDPDFLTINGFDVLLPVDRAHHPNITILRCIESADGDTLTLFLKDTTYVEDPEDEFWGAGYVAICDKFPGADWYITIFYHEWYMVENPK
jgi:hypothetical protein